MKQFNILQVMGIVAITILVTVGVMGSAFISNYNTLKESNSFKYELIKSYERYYDSCELYLDELNESTDIHSGSDIEVFYLDCRAELDSLYATQL